MAHFTAQAGNTNRKIHSLWSGPVLTGDLVATPTNYAISTHTHAPTNLFLRMTVRQRTGNLGHTKQGNITLY